MSIKRVSVVILTCFVLVGAERASAQGQSAADVCQGIGALGFVMDLLADREVVETNVVKFCEDYSKTQNKVSELERKIEGLSISFQSLSKRLPAGAVVAFDLRSGCPNGWEEFSVASGKVIVGVGQGRIEQSVGPDLLLSFRSYGEQGGLEKYALQHHEMPAHNHGGLTGTEQTIPGGLYFSHYANNVYDQEIFYSRLVGRGTPADVAGEVNIISMNDDVLHQHAISSDGGGAAHENMPPFIALHYCVRRQ